MGVNKKLNVNELEQENTKLKLVATRLKVIESFAAEVFSYDDLDDILWAITKNAIANLQFIDCVIYLVDFENGVLIQQAAHGDKNPKGKTIKDPIEIPIGSGIVGAVAKHGKIELIHDTSLDHRYIKDDSIRFSELAVPIKVDNQVIGVIDSEHPDKNYFTKEHVEIIKTISIMAANKIKQLMDKKEILKYQNQLELIVDERTSALNETIIALENSNKDLEQYAHIASHDLQEPLLTIKNFIDLIIKKEKSLSSESKSYMQFIIKSASEMQALLKGLLEFSKVSEGVLNTQICDINEIVRNVIENLNFTIKKTGTNITISNDLPKINAVSVLIKQVFQNLISNALKFNSTIEPKIKIGYKIEKEFLVFEIRDNGIGIDASETEKIFDLFYKLPSKGKEVQGSGLGLSICKRIIEFHRGNIGVYSNETKKGSTFFFKLPKRLLINA